MKSLKFTLIWLVVLCVGLAGVALAADKSRLDVILERGYILVGTTGDYKPLVPPGLTPIFTPDWSISAKVLKRSLSAARIKGDLPTLMYGSVSVTCFCRESVLVMPHMAIS